MKVTSYLYMASIAAMLCACKGQTTNDQNGDSIWVAPEQINAVIDLGEIEQSDTITVRGRLYHYSFRLAPADSLPVITNSDGVRYHDNVATLTIRRDSTVVMNRRFTKQSFASMVPSGKMNDFALVGFSYNLNHSDDHTQLRFIATVGDPDETAGIYYPVELRIATDGSCSLHEAEDFETESLFEGLNLDPADNQGV